MAEAEGFEPPCPCGQTVFKFYPLFVILLNAIKFNAINYLENALKTVVLLGF